MEMKMTERDKKLLSLLVIVLMIVGFGALLVLPLIDKSKELDAQILDAEYQKTLMDEKLDMYPINQQNVEISSKEWKEANKEYYKMMESQEIDKLITNKVLESGLESKDMVITILTEPIQLAYYYASGASLVQQADEVAQSEAAEQAQSEMADEKSSTEPSADTSNSVMEQQDIASQIYTASVNLQLEGSEDNAKALVDSFTNDYPAIRVTKLTYSDVVAQDVQQEVEMQTDADGNIISVPVVKTEAGKMSLEIGLELYMCDK